MSNGLPLLDEQELTFHTVSRLSKAQRKFEIQIDMLKEKVRLTQPTTSSSSQPKEATSSAPLANDIPPESQSQPKAGVNRVSSSTFRRATFKPQRSASVTSNNGGPAKSDTVNSRTSSSARSSTQVPRESVVVSRASYSAVPPTQTSELTSPPPIISSTAPARRSSVFSPISNAPAPVEESFAGIGKRKRTFEEDAENQRLSIVEAVVVPPTSPSRIRQLAERGLRSIAPRLSPKKKFAQLMDEADLPPTNPFAPISFDNIEPSSGRQGVEESHSSMPPTAPAYSKASEAQAPSSRRTRPGASGAIRPRIRLQDMLSGGR